MTWANAKPDPRRARGGLCLFIAVVFCACGLAPLHAKPLGRATLTEINNDVRYQPTGGAERKAKRQDVVSGSDVIRTGPKSQAEMEFEDRTITRLGSNSILTFDPEKRQLELKKGLLLFDMPKNAGGGRIITPAGTAAIEGTAGVISYRSPMKVICLAGTINILNPQGGVMASLKPGQMFIQGVTPKPVDVKLKGMNGKLFAGGLPNNQQELNDAANQQQQLLNTGALAETPFVMIGEGADVLLVNDNTTTIDNSTITAGVEAITGGGGGGTPPADAPVAIGSDATINTSAATIVNNANPPQTIATGTVDGNGVAQFDFGSKTVNLTGDPAMQTSGGQDAKVGFNTTGNLNMTDFGKAPVAGPDVTCVSGQGNNITVQNSELGANSKAGVTGEISLKATANLIVDPTTLHANGYRETNPDGSPKFDGGTVTLQSGGNLQLTGTGAEKTVVDVSGKNGGTATATGNDVTLKDAAVDARGNPNDGGNITVKSSNAGDVTMTDSSLLASGGSAGTGGDIKVEGGDQVNILGTAFPVTMSELYARGVNAGSVVIEGTGPLSSVIVQGTFIDVSSTASSAGQGGSVSLDGKMLVQLQGNTAIDASGPAPGTIKLTSLGSALTFGTIELDSASGPIGLWAQNAAHGLGAPLAAGTIDIQGVATPSGPTIQFDASGGGDIRLSGNQKITVQNASFNLNGGSCDAGRFLVGQYNTGAGTVSPAQMIDFQNVTVDANSAAGAGAQVKLYGQYGVDITGGFSPSTDIQANGGGGAGSIEVKATGIGASPGKVRINAGAAGYVRLSAQQVASLLNELPGHVTIAGALNGYTRSINIMGWAGTSGGLISIGAPETITIQRANLAVNGISGGQITLGAGNITLEDAILNATGFGGPGGTITLNGTAAGLVSITDSELLASSSYGVGGTITLKGGTVTLLGNSLFDASASGSIFIYSDNYSYDPTVTFIGHLHLFTYDGLAADFLISGSDTIDASTGEIRNGATVRFTGTVDPDTGLATFDFADSGVRLQSTPTLVGAPFKVAFNTGQNLIFANFDNSSCLAKSVAGAATGDILIRDSTIKVMADGSGPGSISFTAGGNLTVDPSMLTADSGGSIALTSLGSLSFLGAPGVPSAAFATTVNMASLGENAGDKLLVRDARIGSGTLGYPGDGGQVSLDSKLLTRIEGTTTIDSSETSGPGGILVSASGTGADVGQVALDAAAGPILLSAVMTRTLPALGINDIGIEGMVPEYYCYPGSPAPSGTTYAYLGPYSPNVRNIILEATGTAGGGEILLSGSKITVRFAGFNVSADNSLAAGRVWMGRYEGGLGPSHNIALDGVIMNANSPGGTGGEIKLLADESIGIIAGHGSAFPSMYGANTDIQAVGGGGAGTITVKASGNLLGLSKVLLAVQDMWTRVGKSYLRLAATKSLPPVPPSGLPLPGSMAALSSLASGLGQMQIAGETVGGAGGAKTINIEASGPMGGEIKLNAPYGIQVAGADLTVAGGSSRLTSLVRLGDYDGTGTIPLPSWRIKLTDASIEANAASGGAAGKVELAAARRVEIETGTDIQANGAVAPGEILVKAGFASGEYSGYTGPSGETVGDGHIHVVSTDQGYVRLSAQQTGDAMGALANGNIALIGAVYRSDRTVKLLAESVNQRGHVAVRAAADALIRNAVLNADSPSGSLSVGGVITVAGKNITLDNAVLSAISFSAFGGGIINLNGEALGLVSITDSSLLAYGGLSSPDGTIYIRGGTVDFFGANTLDAGPNGAIYIFRDAGNAIPSYTAANLFEFLYQAASPFTIGSADTVDVSTTPTTGPRIVDAGGTRFTGWMESSSGIAHFDLFDMDVIMTGDPTFQANVGQEFKTSIRTEGNLTFDNLGNNPPITITGPVVKLVHAEADTMLVRNSQLGAAVDASGSGSVELVARGNLTVDPSIVSVSDDSGTPAYDGGTVYLHSGGTLTFEGTPGSPGSPGTPSQALATGLNGGKIGFNYHFGMYAGADVDAGDTVIVRDANISASAPEAGSGVGGQVALLGKLLVRVEGTTLMDACAGSSGTVGSMLFQSPGRDNLRGRIELDAQSGSIWLVAGAPNFPSPPQAGQIWISGVKGVTHPMTAGFDTSGPYGGGDVIVSGSDRIQIFNSSFNTSGGQGNAGAVLMGNYDGSTLTPAQMIDVSGMTVNAGSDAAGGGRVELQGAQRVVISDGTDIQANDTTGSGRVIVRSPGPGPGIGGMVSLDASGGNVNLSARNSSGYVPPTAGKGIYITGQEVISSAGRSVELDVVNVVNPGADGSLRMSAPDDINVSGAAINVGGQGLVQMAADPSYTVGAHSITVSGTIIRGNSGGGSGSDLKMLAKNSVTISGGTSPSTDIQMNGLGGAGNIDIEAQGDGPGYTAGQVSINAGNQGYVRLSAQQTADVLAALPNGKVEIVGVATGVDTKSINVVAASPMAAGNHLQIAAIDAIRIQHAKLSADAYNGGMITLAANNIALNNAILSAVGSVGMGGIINLNGGSAGLVSLVDSSLLAYGATAGGNIYIRGGELQFNSGSALNAGPTGNVYLYGNLTTPLPTVIGNLTTGGYVAP